MIWCKDNSFHHKKIVIEGYNKCSEEYSKARYGKEEPSLKLLANTIPDCSSVLDIGCGSGIPVSKLLAERFQVTGVDISEKQIEQAKVNVSEANFIHQDIMDFDFGCNQWDAMVSFYMIFHLTKREQRIVFDKAICGLKSGGYILFTVSLENEHAYTEDHFFNTTMFWDNYSLIEYKRILTNKGIRILYSGIIDHGFNDEFNGKEEKHPIIFGLKEGN